MLSPEHILRTGFGFAASNALLSAVELGLFTELGKGPRSGGQLRRALGLSERLTPDLLDALVALGLLEREGDDAGAVYMNTRESGHFLDRNSPGYLGDFLARLDTAAGGELAQQLRGGVAPAAGVRSADWAQGLIACCAHMLAERFDFSSHATVAESGASPAELARHLRARHPHLQCVTFDAPPAGWPARPLEGRMVIPRADVIILTRLLRHYDLDGKRAFTQAASGALPEGGCLIVIEHLLDEGRRRDAFGLLMSLQLQAGGGFDFTGADFSSWCRDAGFAHIEVMPLVWPVAAAVARK